MGPFLVVIMFNLISLFRAINLDNNYYKFGNGGFWKFIGPLGFILGALISKTEFGSKVPFIIGAIFNVIIVVSLLLFS